MNIFIPCYEKFQSFSKNFAPFFGITEVCGVNQFYACGASNSQTIIWPGKTTQVFLSWLPSWGLCFPRRLLLTLAALPDRYGLSLRRFGHTLIPSFFRFFNKHHEYIGQKQLRDAFFKPYPLYQPGTVDMYLLGMINDNIQKRDTFLTSEVTDHLFESKPHEHGVDLAALNIQRGRDHGKCSNVSDDSTGSANGGTWTDLRWFCYLIKNCSFTKFSFFTKFPFTQTFHTFEN